MEQGSVFKSNHGQVVHLPKTAAFPADVTRVDIVTIGRSRLLVPCGEAWDTWFASESVTSDYLDSRDHAEDSRPDT